MRPLELPKEFTLRFADMSDAGLTKNEVTLLTELVKQRDTAVRADERERLARIFEGKGGNVWGVQLQASYQAVADFLRSLR